MSVNISTNTSESSDDSTPTRVRRSKVWEYFESNLVEADDGFKAVCKYCQLQLSTKSGTSSLRTHIQKYFHAISEAERNKFISTLKKPIENFVFDPQVSRERMIEFVIHAEIPFNKSEFDIYFDEECVEDIENFDILSWWKAHAEKFLVLSVMARDFLAIPLSTVPSESAFSLGGRILGETRSSLTPEMLEALICAKDWLFKEKGVSNEGQEISEDQPTESDMVTFVTPSGITVSVPREDLTQVPTFL